jgi:hypothetical protein
VAHGTHCMQKNRFGVMFPGVLFVESYWSHLSKKIVCQRFVSQTHEMHYMTHRSHRMQKHTFCRMCPNALLVESVPVAPEHKK